MNVLDAIQNKIGTFTSAATSPTAGASSVTYTGTMKASELVDPTDTCRILIYADYGEGFKLFARGERWTGHPGAAAPFATLQFNPDNPPDETRAELENDTQCLAGLSVAYAA